MIVGDAMTRGSLRAAIGVIVLGLGCRSPASRQDGGVIELPVEVVREPRDALGLRAALGLARTKEFGKWRFDTQNSDRPPAAPDEVTRAIDSLLAWDRPGATFTVGCDDTPSGDRPFPALLDIARAALVLASSPTDPRMHAVLHLADELRAPANGQFAIDAGIGLALEAGWWLQRHDAAASQPFIEYAPEQQLFDRYLRAGQRCAYEIAHAWLDAAARRGELPTAAQIRAGATDVRAKALLELDAFCERAIAAQRAAGSPEALHKLSAALEQQRPAGPYLTVASAQCRGDFAAQVIENLRAYAAIIEERASRAARVSRSSSPKRP